MKRLIALALPAAMLVAGCGASDSGVHSTAPQRSNCDRTSALAANCVAQEHSSGTTKAAESQIPPARESYKSETQATAFHVSATRAPAPPRAPPPDRFPNPPPPRQPPPHR